MSEIGKQYRANVIGIISTACVLLLFGLFVSNSFYVTTLVFALIAAIPAIGLTLLFGFAGLASLGQAAFVGIGAYSAALLTDRLGLPPILSVISAIIIATIAGWVVARPLLRLGGHYLTMVSLAFGVMMYLVFSQMSSITGGLDPGFLLTTPFGIGPWNLGNTFSMYWVCAIGTVVTLIVAINLEYSRVGRGLRALRSSEPAAEGVGIDTVAYKSMVFATAAGMAGFSGALYAFFMRSFNASAFSFQLSIELLIIVIIGSLRSIWGALFGALIVTLLPAVLEHFNDYKLFIYGAIMVLIMMFLPDGLFHGLLELRNVVRNRKAKA
ncbi:branched-chain amino acid ABC transporter permease [Mesorhizobium sp. CCNWLW179-1]|uniref:branched-chain amino acid ABC transporter permease n=1 Tax=unclassified Mesorhizobium TaxID=325217 RepID=UPI0030145A8D